MPIGDDNARHDSLEDAAPALIAYLADDDTVVPLARAVLDAADCVASGTTADRLAALSAVVDALGAAVAAAGVAPAQVPAAAAALTAHIHRLDRR